MIRKLALALVFLAAACTASAPVDQAPAGPAATPPQTAATFVGIDGRPLVDAKGVIDNSVQEALTADPAACAKAGGSLQPVCRMQKPICLIKFADADKACTDGAQCGSGRCLATGVIGVAGSPAKGACAATNDPCGCAQRVEGGIAQVALCAD